MMNEIVHTVFMAAAILAILTVVQFLKYRTPMARSGALFLAALACTLLSASLRQIVGAALDERAVFAFQYSSFFFLTIFWFMLIWNMFRRPEHPANWVVPAALVGSGIVLASVLIRWAASSSLRDSFAPVPHSFFQLPSILGAIGIFFVGLYLAIKGTSIVLLLRLYRMSDQASRRVVLPMLVGTLLFVAVTGLEFALVRPDRLYHLVEIAQAAASFLLFGFTLIWRFGGVLPISRESVFEVIQDGVIILDYYNRVVDINHSARRILGLGRANVKDEKLSDFWPAGAGIIADQPDASLIEQECDLRVDGKDFTFDINISRLVGLNDIPTGRLVVLRNVTGRERMEKALNERAQELERTNKFLAALSEVTVNLHEATDPAEIMSIVGSELGKLDLACYIAQQDPETNDLVLRYTSIAPEVMAQIRKRIGGDLVGRRLNREQFLTVYQCLEMNEIRFLRLFESEGSEQTGQLHAMSHPAILQMTGLDPTTMSLVVPLVTGTRVLGVLGVWGKDLRETDIAPFHVFASQVAHVMERAILYETAVQRSADLARSNSLVMALANVTSVLGSTSNSEKVLDLLGSELQKSGLSCAVATIDKSGETARIQYLSFGQEVIQKIEKLAGLRLKNYAIPKRYWPGERILHEQDPIWYAQPKNVIRGLFAPVPDPIARQTLDILGFGETDQICILPLSLEGGMLGAMLIWGPDLKVTDSPILRIFASQVAGILSSIANYEDEVHRRNELARSNAMIMALSNVAAQLDTTSDLSQVFYTLGSEMEKVRIHCMVGTLDDAKQMMKIEYLSITPDLIWLAEKFGTFWPKEIVIPRRLWPTDKALTEKVPYWDPDPIASVIKMFPFLPRQVFLRSFEVAGMGPEDQVCYLPMISEEDVIGILAVWGPEIQQEDIPGLSVFANQVATAIRNARLFDQAQNEIVERTQAEIRVQQALTEKEVLLKEVHHRVKNNLQVITSLLNLQAAQSTDSATVDLLRESQNRVRSMALIHEKLYQSNDLARIDFAGYLHNLVQSLAQTYRVNPNQVAIRVQCEKIALDLDAAIPCGLIVNELISNSLKYAFPNGASGCIEVICQRVSGGRYQLVVADNGKGLPDGFAVGKGASLGLKLVTSLARQIDGELSVDGSHGARFSIVFADS